MTTTRAGVTCAIAAAALFGASTPFAKTLVGETDPLILAGLLYCGSGLGLTIVQFARVSGAGSMRRRNGSSRLDWRWLALAILLGGVIGPVLLMYGLALTDASSASLLLNFESAFTALLAWLLFRENFDYRIAAGMALIVVGAVVLSWAPGTVPGLSPGALLVTAACACWALDNNLTRKVSDGDPLVIAASKGFVAGAINLTLGLCLGRTLPGPGVIAAAAAVGFFGYGVSLVLFIVALRHLGTARTGAYFAVAPFFGALLAVLVNDDVLTFRLGSAGLLMGIGVWLHLAERHEHAHVHEAMDHRHPHTHDAHHRHEHDFAWDGGEPHEHAHVHERIEHRHPHAPDTRHRHKH